MKKYLIILLLVIISLPSWAVDGVSLDPSQNLFSARHLGMAGLCLGFSDDGNGVFSNPADTTDLQFPQLVGLSRKMVFNETQYSLFGWAWPTNLGTFGIGFVGMGTDGSYTTKLDPATGRIILDPSFEATSFSNSVMAVSYAKDIRPNLSLGGNLKIINQSLTGGVASRASAMGLDLAAVYKVYPWLTTAANLQNVLEPNLSWSGGASDKLGGFYKLGCKVNVLGTQEAIKKYAQTLNAGLDIDIAHSNMAGSAYHLGLEYFPVKDIAIRTGINPGFGLTFGLGLTNGGFRFDYAYANRSGIPGDTPHYFSLSYVGERVVTKSERLKKKLADFIFIHPQDRHIVASPSVEVRVIARAKKIIDETTTWTVTALSSTSEVNEIFKYENLVNASFNGVMAKDGTIETTAHLNLGRNVLTAYGYTSPEAGMMTPLLVSGEIKVLRFYPFSDTPIDHWAIRPIALCSTLGLVKGYPDESFKPIKGITRAELVTLLVRTLPIDLEQVMETERFKDVAENHWAAKYIAYGAEKGLIQGYPNNIFKPAQVLTRAEGITILARYAGLSEEANAKAPYYDLPEKYWANRYIAAAHKAGMIKYLAETASFEVKKPFPREEACEVLYWTPIVQNMVDEFWEKGIIFQSQPAKTTTPQPIMSTSEATRINHPEKYEIITKIPTPETKPASVETKSNK